MPRIDIDKFDEEPSIGDKVKVVGKVKSIEDGMVEMSYDKVTIIDEKKAKSRKDNNDDFDDFEGDMVDESSMSNAQSLDQALSKNFSQYR